MVRKILIWLLVLFFVACEEEQSSYILKIKPVPGKIEIFNSCGIPGAANDAKDVLRSYGFDVLSAQTDPNWSNYEETIVTIRNPHWGGDSTLKSLLNTKNFLTLQDTLSGIIDATIFLGKDYRTVLRIM